MYERYDRVRLTREHDRIPVGTEGVIAGPFIPDRNVYLVQIPDWGMKEIPDDILEPVEGQPDT